MRCWRAVWCGGGTISYSVCPWKRRVTTAGHWSCSCALRWHCAGDGSDCLLWDRSRFSVHHSATGVRLSSSAPAKEPAFLNSQSRCAASLFLRLHPFWHTAAYMRALATTVPWPVERCVAAPCRCWRTPVLREGGSVFSCTEHLCRQSSPVVCTTFTPSPFMTTASGWSLGLLKSSTSSLNNAHLPQWCFYNVSLEEVLYGF